MCAFALIQRINHRISMRNTPKPHPGEACLAILVLFSLFAVLITAHHVHKAQAPYEQAAPLADLFTCNLTSQPFLLLLPDRAVRSRKTPLQKCHVSMIIILLFP